jgi:glycosyltransferase involved in cell wall biosynthesis
LIDPENAVEFAAAISRLLADPEECRRLGKAGYERCLRLFDWQTTAEKWLALLHHASKHKTSVR